MNIPPSMPPIEFWPSATIETSYDGTWHPTGEQPDPNGISALLYQIWEADGSLYDTVASEIHHPTIWWLRWGRATFLGEWCIAWANRESQPVRLVRSPAEYLRYVPAACCILNWTADVPAILNLARKGWICSNATLLRRARRGRERRAISIDLVPG